MYIMDNILFSTKKGIMNNFPMDNILFSTKKEIINNFPIESTHPPRVPHCLVSMPAPPRLLSLYPRDLRHATTQRTCYDDSFNRSGMPPFPFYLARTVSPTSNIKAA